VITDISAGMRTPPGVRPRAAYTIDLSTVAAAGTGYTYASNVLTFTTAANGNTYTITGSTTTKRIVVATGVTADITLSGVSMTHATLSPFELQGTANVTLTLTSGTTNTLKCSATTATTNVSRAGLTVPSGTTLTIAGTGTLNATGGKFGAGIGGYGYYTSASVYGGTDAGKIIINSGTVDATGGEYSAGIGGGYRGTGGTITISGSTVNAMGGYYGAGIGGGSLTLVATNITISGSTVNATGGTCGAGIGSGGRDSASAGVLTGCTITVNSGMVNAMGGINAAGIGGGISGAGGNITINGGTVIAKTNVNPSYAGGAGIGSGVSGAGGNITISGGTVEATGGYNGAGIGGGSYGSPATLVQLDAAATVKAYANTSAQPAIWASSITGTGYYFNGYLTSGVISSSPTTLDVCLVGSITATDTLTLPGDYISFAYSTGSASETNNIRVYDSSSALIGVIVYTANNNANIVSDTNSTVLQQVKFGYLALGTLSHSNVTDTTADLTSTGHSFTIGTMDAATAFQYDIANTFGTIHYTQAFWTSPGASPYTANLTGLNSNTMYYYRVYLKNEYGNVTSATQTFVTLPQITSWSPSVTSGTTATVSGSIAASLNGQAITGVVVTYDTSSSFSSPTSITLTSGEFNDTSFSTNLTGLTAGVIYYAKVEVTNAGGTTTSTVKQFQASYGITEKFVDLSGSSVDTSGLPDNTVSVTSTYTATGIPTSHTVGGNTYTYLGYKLDSYTTGDALTSGTPSAVTITGNRDVYYVYAIAEGSIKIEKYDNGGTTMLTGTEFKVEKLLSSGGAVDTSFTALTQAATGGTTTFSNLPAGIYRITETKAPTGYDLLIESFEVTIPTDVTLPSGQTPTDTSYLYSTTSGGNIIYHYYDVTYKVSDQASIAMPSAGMMNTLPPYALIGGIMILLAACGGGFLWLKRRRAYAHKHG